MFCFPSLFFAYHVHGKNQVNEKQRKKKGNKARAMYMIKMGNKTWPMYMINKE
jgi:hypothetical protein